MIFVIYMMNEDKYNEKMEVIGGGIIAVRLKFSL